jgi:hypothetical protein
MQSDQFLGVWRRRPFRAFVIHTGSDETYKVPHPEQVTVSETGRTVGVFLPREEMAIIDMDAITEIVASPSPGRRKSS